MVLQKECRVVPRATELLPVVLLEDAGLLFGEVYLHDAVGLDAAELLTLTERRPDQIDGVLATAGNLALDAARLEVDEVVAAAHRRHCDGVRNRRVRHLTDAFVGQINMLSLLHELSALIRRTQALHLPQRKALRAEDTEPAIAKLLQSVKVLRLRLRLGLGAESLRSHRRLLCQMHEVDATLRPVYLEEHKLARVAADHEEAARDRLVHLHQADNVVLVGRQPHVAVVLLPRHRMRILEWHDRQVLLKQSLPTRHRLPHRNETVRVPCHDKLIDLAEAVDGVVLFHVRNVRVRQEELLFFERIMRL